MKKIINILFMMSVLDLRATATPYFRIIDPSHPNAIAGVLLDPKESSSSEATTLLPVVTHSPRDGCLLPSVVCEDWTPLAVGVSLNAGKFSLAIAPLANVIPWLKTAAMSIIPDSWGGVLAALNPSSISASPVSFSAGPAFEYRQSSDKGYFRVFTGIELKF